jgi:hydroxyacylglutathione hydrolase
VVAQLGIQKVHVGAKDTNCYVVTCTQTRQTVVIDPGDDPTKIQRQLGSLPVAWIVFTHAHPGHVGAKDAIKSATGAPTAMHLADATAQLKSADRYLIDGDSLPFGQFALQVIATPGHTPGGLSFRVGNHLFTGDTLMAGRIGRVDLPGSSPPQMAMSLQARLLALPDNTVIYPGHGANTTVGTERISNPYLRMRDAR